MDRLHEHMVRNSSSTNMSSEWGLVTTRVERMWAPSEAGDNGMSLSRLSWDVLLSQHTLKRLGPMIMF